MATRPIRTEPARGGGSRLGVVSSNERNRIRGSQGWPTARSNRGKQLDFRTEFYRNRHIYAGAVSVEVHTQLVAKLCSLQSWPPHPRPRPSPGRGENPKTVSQGGQSPPWDTVFGICIYWRWWRPKNANAPQRWGACPSGGLLGCIATVVPPPPASLQGLGFFRSVDLPSVLRRGDRPTPQPPPRGHAGRNNPAGGAGRGSHSLNVRIVAGAVDRARHNTRTRPCGRPSRGAELDGRGHRARGGGRSAGSWWGTSLGPAPCGTGLTWQAWKSGLLFRALWDKVVLAT